MPTENDAIAAGLGGVKVHGEVFNVKRRTVSLLLTAV